MDGFEFQEREIIDKDGGLRLADEARGEFNAGFSLRVRCRVPSILFSLFLIHLPVAVCQY